MTASQLTPTTRYFPPGTRQYYWVPTIAILDAPTRPELDAGIDLTPEIVDDGVSGFTVTANTVDAADAGKRYTGKVRGRTSTDNSSIKFYTTSDGSDDVRTVFHDGDAGFIVIFPEGDHPPVVGPPAKSFKLDVWPAEVLTDPSIDQGMQNAGQVEVMFAITNEPARNKPVPT